MFDLKNKVVLVTGASRGIGASIATAVGQAGADVVLHYGKSKDAAEKVAAGLDRNHTKLIGADLTKDDETQRLWQEAVAWKGRVNVVILNAGMMDWAGPDDDFEKWDEVLRRTLQTNVFAAAHLCRDAVRHYRTQGGGIIIGISSHVAHQGVRAANSMAYAASKGALKALLQSIARCFSRENILTYTIAPGLTATEIAEDFIDKFGKREDILNELAMKEMVPPEDIANICAFLATGASRHATGTTIDVTGANYIR